MPDTFSVSMFLVILVVLLVAAPWTRDAGEHRADAAMTARGLAEAAAAARCNFDGNSLRSSDWPGHHGRRPFEDLAAALSASYAAKFEQAVRTIRVGPPGDWWPTDQTPGEPEFKAAGGAPPHE